MSTKNPRKVIVDTSIWIEFLKKNPKIFPSMKILLEKNNVIVLECIFGELIQGTISNRERDIILSYWDNLPKIEEAGIWLEAGKYYSDNDLFKKGLGLIDSIIITAALKNDYIVWTLDKKLNSAMGDRQKYQ